MKANSLTRTKLSYITNTMNQLKPSLIPEKPTLKNGSDNNYDQLVKENMALVKSLREKNKIIELTGIEIQKLRTFLERMQLQNRSLAQSNSYMLAELNMGKDRLKVLQHELACKEAILKSKDKELKEQNKVNIHTNKLQETDEEETKDLVSEAGHEENGKPVKTNKRERPSRSRSLGSQAVSQLHTKKEAVGSKRRCSGIQSASSKITHQEQNESLFEINDAKSCDSKPSNAPSVEIQVIENDYESKSQEKESQRTSTGRPTRRSVAKVQSYKEIPLNVKMRRPVKNV